MQVFGRRDDETDHALKRPATKNLHISDVDCASQQLGLTDIADQPFTSRQPPSFNVRKAFAADVKDP